MSSIHVLSPIDCFGLICFFSIVLVCFSPKTVCHIVACSLAWLPKKSCKKLAVLQKQSEFKMQQPPPLSSSTSTSPLPLFQSTAQPGHTFFCSTENKAKSGQRASCSCAGKPSMLPWQWALKDLPVACREMLGVIARRLCLLDRIGFGG